MPLLYLAVERARRRVCTAFGTPPERTRLSDATLTRLRPTPPLDGAEEGGGRDGCARL